MNQSVNLNSGHRQRLKKKFILNGLDGFLDYEIIELLLILGTPRRDCKQAAKNLLSKFGSLKNVLDADSTELRDIHGVGDTNSIGISIIKSVLERYNKDKADKKKTLDNAREIAAYLQHKIGNSPKERLYALFLDTKNNLIDREVSVGILNANLIHPREVFEAAITHHASHIVLAHNHPTGDTSPSKADVITTKRLVEAGKVVGIEVVDHLIISRDGYTSFKEIGLLE